MPTILNGFYITKSARLQNIPTELVVFEVAAGETKTISFPEQAGGIALSVQLENQDGANAATYQVNGVTTPTQNLGASQFRGINDIPINTVKVVAGAAGSVLIRSEIARFGDI